MELSINLPPAADLVAVAGPQHRYFKLLREALDVAIHEREGTVRISGRTEVVGQAALVIERLADHAARGRVFSRQQVLDLVAAAAAKVVPLRSAREASADGLDVYLPGKIIRPASEGQRAYVASILKNDLTFGLGPAGSGKTFLAVAAAVSMLKHGRVRKLILARPAVEAGEKIGFLPGTLQDKVNPYLRPLLDALHDTMPFDQVERFLASDVIEVVPLAFMRGRTLNDACVILDEAQNTTRGQMLMFLTRLGLGAKMVVVGDPTQVDLPHKTESGLADAWRRLQGIPGIGSCELTNADIVRHGLVQRVLDAYGQEASRLA